MKTESLKKKGNLNDRIERIRALERKERKKGDLDLNSQVIPRTRKISLDMCFGTVITRYHILY